MWLVPYVIIFLGLTCAERLNPKDAGMPKLHLRDVASVLVFYALNIFLTDHLGDSFISGHFRGQLSLKLRSVLFEDITDARGAFILVPMALTTLALLSYWSHRLLHSRWLWPIHSVHHYPARLNWFTGFFSHPLVAVYDVIMMYIPLYLMFDSGELRWAFMFFGGAALFAHANVDIKAPYLNRLLVFPYYHRLHHSRRDEDINSNFSVFSPLIDRLFGTERQSDAQEFGVKGARDGLNVFELVLCRSRGGNGQ